MYAYLFIAATLFDPTKTEPVISEDLERAMEEIDTNNKTCEISEVDEETLMVNCVDHDLLV